MQNKLKQGEALFAEGKIEEAENCFLEMLDEAPKNKEAYNNLGVIASQKGDIESAINEFQNSLEIDPYYRDAVINIVTLLRALDQSDKAASILSDYIENSPPDHEIKAILNEIERGNWKAETGPDGSCNQNIPKNPAHHMDIMPEDKNEAQWSSMWKQLRVEDILKEPSHQEIVDNVAQHITLKGQSFLEVGCGTGATGMSLAQYGAEMTLLDKSQESLKLSKKVLHHQGLSGVFVHGDMFDLPFPDNSFDVVGSFGVLEHFSAQEIVQAIREMKRVSKRYIVTTVPNARCAFYRVAKWWAEKTNTWQYGYEKPEYSMAQYFEEVGLSLFREYSIGFIVSLYFLRRIPDTKLLQKLALAFNQEIPNAIDGSLIISFCDIHHEVNTGVQSTQGSLEIGPKDDSNPLISLLMCAWNEEKFIEDAILSVLNQTYDNFELVIVDDGSTDRTKEVISEFNDPRIKYFLKEHSGLADLRNFALSKAKGEYIVIIDADDIVAPDLLERELEIFRQYPGQAIVVYTNIELIDSRANRTGIVWRYRHYDRREIVPALFRAGKNIVPGGSMMIPISILEKVGKYNVDLRDLDTEYIARLPLHVSRFVCIDKPLYLYRKHKGTLSSGSMIKRAESSVAMLKKMLEIFGKDELFPEANWEIMNEQEKEAEFHFRVADVFWRHCKGYLSAGAHYGFLEEVVSHLKSSLDTDPVHKGSTDLIVEINSLLPTVAEDPEIFSHEDLKEEHPRRKPLRILYLADCLSQHTKRYARFFKNRGHEVHIFDTSKHTDDLEDIKLHFPAPIGSNVCENKLEDIFIHNVFELNNLIEEIKPDILHGHYVTGRCWWGAFTGFQPYLITSWGSDIFLDTKNDFNRRFAEFCLRESRIVTAGSTHLFRDTASLRGSTDGMVYILFGIDLEFFRPGYDTSQLAKKLGVNGSKVVLSSRQFKPEANIDVIIKAIPKVIDKVSDAVFILKNYLTKGSSLNKYERYLHELVKKLNVEDNVIFMDDVAFNEMPIIYNLADVMVTLRDTDSATCSMLESMACKTSVVASNIESMREWIMDGENGRLVDQHDPDAVADAISEILLNDEKRRKFEDTSYALVREKADYRKNWGEVEKLYYEVKQNNVQQPYVSGLLEEDLSAVREELQSGWMYIESHKLDKAAETFLKIFGINNLTAQNFMKVLIGMAKIEWIKGNKGKAKEYYLGCLKLLQGFELDARVNIKM